MGGDVSASVAYPPDEAQRCVSASEDGMSDYNCTDEIREAQASIVAAAQSSTLFDEYKIRSTSFETTKNAPQSSFITLAIASKARKT